MPDQADMGVTIDGTEWRAIVSLRVAKAAADGSPERLHLAAPLRVSSTEPKSLWLGPDHWLLVSKSESADYLVEYCAEGLAGILHIAADYSATFAVKRLEGPGTRQLLASGSGLDFRSINFPSGTCCRTRFARIGAIIVAVGANEFELYVDRSYDTYISNWLADSVEIASRAAEALG